MATDLAAHRLASWWPLWQERWPAALGDDGARRRLADLAQHLPGNALCAFEVHLGSLAPRIDLSLRLDDPEATLAAGPPFRLRSLDTLTSLARSWREQGGAELGPWWLELDLAAGGESPLAAAGVFCVRVGSSFGQLPRLLGHLQGAALKPSQERALTRCREILEPAATPLYAFTLRSRPGRPLRVEWACESVEPLRRGLHRLLPSAAVNRAAKLLAGVERPHLALDFTDDLEPRWGLEGSFRDGARQPRRWRDLLARVTAAGLMTREEAAACLAYPGVDRYWTARRLWPVEALGTSGRVIRTLSHLKLAWRAGSPGGAPPGGELAAKAYLLFSPLSSPTGP